MGQRTLLPDAVELQLELLKFDSETIILIVRASRREARCLTCHQQSRRVHSHYKRKLADLPWNGIPVMVRLRTRRFFCETFGCGQHIFTERLPNTVAPHGRRTQRLSAAVDWFTLALGGEAGARLAAKVGIVASGDTLLRQLRRKPSPAPHAPRVLGIDDWAWRKGQRYGTILCDLERHKVVDLLPDRTADTLKQWLTNHSGVAIISRDRASAYAEAAREAAPKAVQVADRWHLLRNLSEALQQTLENRHVLLSQAAKAVAVRSQPTPELCLQTEFESPPSPPTRIEKVRQTNRSRRLARYKSVMELVQQGISQSEISRTLGVGRRTVRRWTRAGLFPERVCVTRRSTLDYFADYLNQRYEEGCHNAATLWRELREQGFHGRSGSLRQWIHRLRPGPKPSRHAQWSARAFEDHRLTSTNDVGLASATVRST